MVVRQIVFLDKPRILTNDIQKILDCAKELNKKKNTNFAKSLFLHLLNATY
jgi:hypothetical protein